jgi:hypothetical protein
MHDFGASGPRRSGLNTRFYAVLGNSIANCVTELLKAGSSKYRPPRSPWALGHGTMIRPPNGMSDLPYRSGQLTVPTVHSEEQ